jgi:hypothetical protein
MLTKKSFPLVSILSQNESSPRSSILFLYDILYCYSPIQSWVFKVDSIVQFSNQPNNFTHKLLNAFNTLWQHNYELKVQNF